MLIRRVLLLLVTNLKTILIQPQVKRVAKELLTQGDIMLATRADSAQYQAVACSTYFS